MSVLAALVPAAAASAASQQQQLEGIWTFDGGRVAVERQANGSYTGTVLEATRFAECTHQVGELMWRSMVEQPDGSFWGLHQWFYDDGTCTPNPILGSTAWRLFETAAGSRYLRVCFSEPGSGSQPTISAAGQVAGTTFGCADSAPVAPLPTAEVSSYVAPDPVAASGKCTLRRRLRLRIRSPRNDPLARVRVTLKAGKARRRAPVRKTKSGFVVRLRLGGLPEGKRFLVVIKVTTVLGRHAKVKRSYSRCAPTAKKKKRSRRSSGHRRRGA